MFRRICAFFLLAAACFLCGCELRTVDQMYCLPERPDSYNNLQTAMNAAVGTDEYCAPISGENRQSVQMADLDGDGIRECLAFIKRNTEKPLQILIFHENNGQYSLTDTIECHGTAFETVEYAQMDGVGGMEIIVGRQVGPEVLRSMSVYQYAGGTLEQLVTTSYSKMVICDLDNNARKDLMLIHPGQTEADNAVAELYSMDQGVMVRSNEAPVSGTPDKLKRIITGCLTDGAGAVFVGSVVDEYSIITDVFALVDGTFTNVSLSNESGTSVQTLRNYYVYADDINDDGEVELPDLITFDTEEDSGEQSRHHVIRWYTMGVDGKETDKLYTHHNFLGGWYLKLNDEWASRVSVVQNGTEFSYYLWDAQFSDSQKIFTIQAFTGQNRETQAVDQNRFVLLRTETTIYSAQLEVASGAISLSKEDLINGFRMIHQDWITGEM